MKQHPKRGMLSPAQNIPFSTQISTALLPKWELWWPYGYCAGLQIGQFWFEPWVGNCVVFWARHVTLMVPLSTQVYKSVPAIVPQHNMFMLFSD